MRSPIEQIHIKGLVEQFQCYDPKALATIFTSTEYFLAICFVIY